MTHTIAALVGLAALAASAEPAKDNTATLFCKHRAFRIPVELSRGERGNLSALRLYVSMDDGRTWSRVGDAPADVQAIPYKASKDGSHCFALATVGKDGTQAPADMKGVEAGLKVVVDSTAPTLNFKPVRTTAGKRGVRWELTDENLDAGSLRLAYCPAGSTTWKSLAIRTPEKSLQWFDEGMEVQKLQASVFDRAGNETIQEIEIAGDRFTKSSATAFALPRSPMDGESKPAAVASSAPAWTPPPMARQLATTSPIKAPESNAALTKPAAVADKPWSPVVQPAGHSQAVGHTAYSPVKPAANKPREHLLCGAEPIVVNYEVDRSSAPGSTAVELWGSKDRGASWTKLAVDADGVSPIEANLPQDAIWGLKIVTRPAGAPETGPKAGTEPDTYLESDRLAPAVMVGAVEVQRGQAIIRWEASDKNMGATPIAIFYGHSPKGPWNEVAKNVDNVGEYVWNYARANVSGVVYFRVEAVDEAKNTGVSHSPMPVSLDGATPKGRVLQVQPAGQARR